MNLDFQNSDCQDTLCEVLFGLCDDNNGTNAYTDLDHPENWSATVRNNRRKIVTFTAIDKCILHDSDFIGRGRCDGLLTTDEHIYFVELKSQARNWISDAIDQLESTILFYIADNDISGFKHKKAFACNKKYRRFQEIDNELNIRFFRKYGIRIDVQAEIIVL